MHPRTLLERARALHQAGALTEAFQCYSSVLKTHPEQDDAWNGLAFLYVQQQEWGHAETCMHHALRYRPGHAPYYNHLAIIALRQHQLDKARACIDEAFRRDPDHPDTRNTQGRLALLEGNITQAIDAFQHAIDRDPLHVEARYNLGFTYFNQANYVQAWHSFASLLIEYPQHTPAHIACAAICAHQQDWNGAIAHYRAVLSWDPGHTAVQEKLAVALGQTDTLHTEAADHLAQLARLHPQPHRILMDLGYAYYKQNLEPLAIAHFQAALSHSPHSEAKAECHYRLAHVYHRQEKWDSALSHYRQARLHNPQQATWAFWEAALSQVASQSACPNPTHPTVPQQAPLELVQDLFAQYAPHFEASMRTLHYRTPQALLELFESAHPFQSDGDMTRHIADLGSGTGLMGRTWFNRFPRDRIVGVECAAEMIAVSQQMTPKAYAAHVQEDMLSYLHRAAHYDSDAQLWGILAADVIVYCGDLTQWISSIARVLRPHGWLLFSCEALETGDAFTELQAGDWQLTRHGRYRHNGTYIRRLLLVHGFDPLSLRIIPSTLRHNQGIAVKGYCVYARKLPPLLPHGTPA